ncbi:MAG: tail fiber domain-containing protein [Balneola sp.]
MLVFLLSVNAYAQVPQGFNFQAVARGSDGLPLLNQELGVRISILEGSDTGQARYVETHTVTTNGVGLIQLIIGQGTPVETSFGDVNWSGFDNYVKLEIDPAGGTEFEVLGTSQLLSVPYALLSENVVNGGSGGSFPLNLELNNANQDTSFVINLTGDGTAKPFQVFSSGSGYNGAVWGEALSDENNEGNQRGVLGFANGTGTGTHIGTFGSAVNFDATGNTRMGAYGQAASKAKFNMGVYGFAMGDGSGETEIGGGSLDFGSFNLGGYFIGNGNLNGNTGVHGIASGSKGSLRNFGVIGTSIVGSEGANIGVRAEASTSSTYNTAFDGEANGASKNMGLRLNVNGGTSNIGMEVNADTAAILNGDVIINGALIHNGSSSGGFPDFIQINTDDPGLQDSLTIVVNGSELESESALGLNVIGFSTGRNRPVLGQIREAASNNASQYAINGRADGLGGGTHIGVLGSAFNVDAANGGTRYGLYGQAASQSKFNFGAYTYATGAGNGDLVPIGSEVDGNFGTFNIGYGTFVSGNANGNNGLDVEVAGDQGSRINIGAEFRVFTTATGQNSGVQSLVKGSSTLNRGFFGLVNGDNNNVGMDLTVEGGTSNIGLIVNAATAAELNGNVFVNGDLNYSGALNNTSDRRLKENIQPLQNGLETIMRLNPTTYNFRGDGEYNGLKLSTGLHYGLIAQEVEQVLPSLVKDNIHVYSDNSSAAGPSDQAGETKTMDYKTMNYTELIPVLIKAVQEQQAEIERLTKEVEKLKSEKK